MDDKLIEKGASALSEGDWDYEGQPVDRYGIAHAVLDASGLPGRCAELEARLTDLVGAVEVHKRYWQRIDWGSERAERMVFDAIEKAHKALGREGSNEQAP